MTSRIVELRLNQEFTPETIDLIARLTVNAEGSKKSMISWTEAAMLVNTLHGLMSDLTNLSSVFQELIEEGIIHRVRDTEAPSILDEIPKVRH